MLSHVEAGRTWFLTSVCDKK